ncbi:exodeoxyribonuclease VII small subunit [Helicobacter mustelae]|uniref:exodeoxyribonuclease VII small subunit n=1 Tax=Helicobacter mustelae TaxID=217 RepID=UPI000DFE5CB8|nr:exodeoxyribonuclease VII small subunit [Helicobacter mustelae]STP12734.1 exodeoxyribonuclease VII small subunit [Helicobacter mustelae]
MDDTRVEQRDFEQRVERIKEILASLSDADLSLKEGLSLYKEGIKELQEAQEMLEIAKMEYEAIKINSKDKS